MPKAKVKVIDESLDDRTPLQKFLVSNNFDSAMMILIALNCVWIAASNPNPAAKDPEWVVTGGFVFSTVFIAEAFLKIISYGFIVYLNNPWNQLDFIVVLISVTELTFDIIAALAKGLNVGMFSNLKILRILRLLRFLRILRPLKAVKFIPSLLDFVNSLIKSGEAFLVNFILLTTVCMALAFISNHVLGDSLLNRCLPANITSPNVTQNPYYSDYGVDYFYSKYNLEFCNPRKNGVCVEGFVCGQLESTFVGVPASFSTPYDSLVSIFSFLSLRGWPNIFWAIAETNGIRIAFLVLVVVVVGGNITIVNLFPAIFINSLKAEEEKTQKIAWLEAFQGDKSSLSEYELLIWANGNQNYLLALETAPTTVGPLSALYSLVAGALGFQQKVPDHPLVIEEGDTTQGRSCVPRMRFLTKIRGIMMDETSPVNWLITAIILANIATMGVQSYRTPELYEPVEFVNKVFTGIFAAEVVVKVVSMGPVLYFDNGFNLLDFCIVGLSIPSYFSQKFRFVNSFRGLRILRLARLLRLARMLRVANTLYEKSKKQKLAMFLNPVKLMGIMVEFATPALNLFLYLAMLYFVYSCLGMDLLYEYRTPRGVSDPFMEAYLTTPNMTKIYDLERSWGGKYLDRMNFNIFSNAFVTMTNVAMYNGWYLTMIDTIRRGSHAVLIFFFTFLLLTGVIPAATVLASLITVMERNANVMLKDIAEDNKNKIERVGDISLVSQVRTVFRLLKKNTLETADSKLIKDAAVKRGEVGEVYEPEPEGSWLDEFLEKHKEDTLYLFDIDHPLRAAMIDLVSNFIFQAIVLAATAATVVATITKDDPAITSEQRWGYVNLFVTAAFLMEMVVKWLAFGLYGLENAYFLDPLSWADFIVNVFMIISIVFPIRAVSVLRILRLLKIPNAMKYVMKSSSLQGLLMAINGSSVSIASMCAIVGVMAIFFSIVGIQLFSGKYGYCSFNEYPAGYNRYRSSPQFPNGCSGYIFVPNKFNSSLPGQNVYIHWKNSLNSYDDIFTGLESTFRVFTMNEWQGILYDTLDGVSHDHQPALNHNRTAFLFFFIIALSACVFQAMTVAIIYYHYTLLLTLNGRKTIFGANDSFWVQYEDKLALVSPIFHENKTVQSLRKNSLLKALVVIFVLIPFFVHLNNYKSPNGKRLLAYFDIVLNLVYVSFYYWRQAGKGWRVYIAESSELQELLVSFYLISSSLITIFKTLVGTFHDNKTHTLMVEVSSVLRVHVLGVFFPQLGSSMRILHSVFTAFIPQLMYCIMVIFVFGILAVEALKNQKPFYGNPFLEKHYNFGEYSRSWVVLISMGFGNMWTEILAAYQKDKSNLWGIFIQVYFTAFLFLFQTFFRTFPLMIIYKFLIHSGNNLGIAFQQVTEFQEAWEKECDNENRINYHTFFEFLKKLPPPLGRKGLSNTYLESSRFAKKVLLCIPMPRQRRMQAGLLKGTPAFTMETLPDDIRALDNRNIPFKELLNTVIPEGTEKDAVVDHLDDGFTFQQIIVAVHKLALMRLDLPDEAEQAARRKPHKDRLRLLRLRLGRVIVSKDSMKATAASSNLLLLQRIDRTLYLEKFNTIMSSLFESLLTRTRAYGFKGFDAFVLGKIRKTIMCQDEAAHTYAKIRETYITPGASKEVQLELQSARDHWLKVRKVDLAANQLYAKNVDKLWEIDSLTEIAYMTDKSGVSFMAIDDSCSVYGVFLSGILKVWSKVGNKDIDETTVFKLTQKIDLKGKPRSLSVSNDGKRLVVGVDNDAVLYAVPGGKRGGRKGFVEVRRLGLGAAPIMSIQISDRFIYTGSEDRKINVWNFRNEDVQNSFTTDSSIFAMTTLPICEPNVAEDERTLVSALVAGSSKGKLYLLPMPLPTAPFDAATEWPGLVVHSDNSPITALTVAWNFVYAGYANGSIKTWAIKIEKTAQSVSVPIKMVKFIPVSNQAVHASPVSSLSFAGGVLFSASQDFSILPWNAPENLMADTAVEFIQTYTKGIVLHSSAIVSMAANKYLIASGDEDGRICLTAPLVTRENLGASSRPDNMSFEEVQFCKFSFLEHDFGHCFSTHQGLTVVEDVILRITNIHDSPVTIRCLSKIDDPAFPLTYDSTSFGGRIVSLKKEGSKVAKEAYQIEPLHDLTLRIAFVPNAPRQFSYLFDFLLNEKMTVRIHVKGYGSTPKIVSDREIFDFGTVFIGSYPRTMSVVLENRGFKDIFVNCLDIPEELNSGSAVVVPETGDGEDVEDDVESGTLCFSSRNVEVIPRLCIVKAKSKASITLRFNPQKEFRTFRIPFKLRYAGGIYTLGTIVGRSELKKSEDGQASLALLTSESSVMLNSSEVALARQNGLRDLVGNEVLCDMGLADKLLTAEGWSVLSSEKLTCFLEKHSGFFLELPAGQDNRALLDVVRINLTCPDKRAYELWHDNTVVAFGVYDLGGAVLPIDIASDELAFTNGDEAFGVVTLELFIFEPGTSERNGRLPKVAPAAAPIDSYGTLRTVYHIKVSKGFRLSPLAEGGPIEPSNRVHVRGVERVISCIKDGAGLVYEVFGDDTKGNRKVAGSPLFAAVTMSLHSQKVSATHFSVQEIVNGSEFTPLKNKNFVDPVGTDKAILKRPKVDVSSAKISRKIKVIFKRSRDVEPGLEEKFECFSDTVPLHVATDVIRKSIAAKISPLSAFPSEVSAANGECLKVEVLLPSSKFGGGSSDTPESDGESGAAMEDPAQEDIEIAKSLDNVVDSIYGSQTLPLLGSNNFRGYWYFVVDGLTLKLISADPEAGAENDVPATEISFLTRGLRVVGETCCFQGFDGEVKFVQNISDLDALSPKLVRYANAYGESKRAEDFPRILTEVWKMYLRDQFVRGIRRAFERMVESRLVMMQEEAKIKSDALQRAFEDKLAEELKTRANKRLTKADLENRANMIKEKFKILEQVPQAINPQLIYDEIATVTAEYAKKKKTGLLNINDLRSYLENEPLAGAEEAYSKIEADVATKEMHWDDKGTILFDSFKIWYKADEGEKRMNSLTERTFFAQILDEELSASESWGVEEGSKFELGSDNLPSFGEKLINVEKELGQEAAKLGRFFSTIFGPSTANLKKEEGEEMKEEGGDDGDKEEKKDKKEGDEGEGEGGDELSQEPVGKVEFVEVGENEIPQMQQRRASFDRLSDSGSQRSVEVDKVISHRVGGVEEVVQGPNAAPSLFSWIWPFGGPIAVPQSNPDEPGFGIAGAETPSPPVPQPVIDVSSSRFIADDIMEEDEEEEEEEAPDDEDDEEEEEG